MLVYHPVFDTNHGMFRMLRLLEMASENTLKWDMFRILDLYYLFPHLISAARLPRSLTSAKHRYGKLDSRYNRVPTPKVFIQQIVGLHETVARSLIGKEFLLAGEFEKGILKRTQKAIPEQLADAFLSPDDYHLVQLLSVEIAKIPLSGPDGLKARTGLLEYRYDAI